MRQFSNIFSSRKAIVFIGFILFGLVTTAQEKKPVTIKEDTVKTVQKQKPVNKYDSATLARPPLDCGDADHRKRELLPVRALVHQVRRGGSWPPSKR